MSLKKLAKLNRDKHDVDTLRQMYYHFYFEYFLNIIVNYFDWQGLPEGIDEVVMERMLFENGHVLLFNDDTVGYLALKGARGKSLNLYGMPTEYNVTTPAKLHHRKKQIIYSPNDVVENSNFGVVIPNTNTYTSYINHVQLFCNKLADIEATIELNRRAQVTPFIVSSDRDNILTLKNVFAKINEYNPVVYINENNKDKVDGTTIEDKIRVFRTDSPYLLDKLHDEKNRVMNQLLTYIGINNQNIDKKERLVASEAISNNGVISANILVLWKSRRNAVDLINKVYGLDISVEPSPFLSSFNIETVKEDLNVNLYGDD